MNTKLIRDWFVYRLLESDFGNVNAGTLADFTVIAPNVEKPKGKRVECSVVFVARKVVHVERHRLLRTWRLYGQAGG